MNVGRSKYSQIVEKLLSDIRGEKYSIGDFLPTEHRLMEAYGVSRHTVRQALQTLNQMGMIEAKQGRGSTVIAAAHKAAFVDKIQSVEALIEKGGELNRRLLKSTRVEADSTLSDAFDTYPGREFLEIHLLRYSDKEPRIPVAYLKVWVDPLFEAISDVLETDGRTVVELMKLKFDRNIGSIRQSITACQLDGDVAAYLERPVGESALHIERRYGETSVTPAHLRTISICRGDLVQIDSHFQST